MIERFMVQFLLTKVEDGCRMDVVGENLPTNSPLIPTPHQSTSQAARYHMGSEPLLVLPQLVS